MLTHSLTSLLAFSVVVQGLPGFHFVKATMGIYRPGAHGAPARESSGDHWPEHDQHDDPSWSSTFVDPPSPPPPPHFTGSMLVNDAAHPYMPPGPDDLRGPCPVLNTLANHGWLPRNGVATPSQLITASQDAFNMENTVARLVTYAAHLVDGNPLTDKISIGRKTRLTGPDPPYPAIVGGLSNHGTFEGDASLTRADTYWGENDVFNEELFEEFKLFSLLYGNGYFNLTVAAELRFHRIQQAILKNPNFAILGLRHTTAYAEVTFPSQFFVDGRKTGAEKGQLDMWTAERFFKGMQFPDDFHRPAAPVDVAAAAEIYAAHPTQPGKNVNGPNTFEPDHSQGSVTDPCAFYQAFVNIKVKGLYPEPQGQLRRNLNKNLQFFYDAAVGNGTCAQVFPYGQD